MEDLINIHDVYGQYQELSLSLIPFKEFKLHWHEYNYEIYLKENTEEPLSFHDFRKYRFKSLEGELMSKKKMIFTIRVASNKKIIVQRIHHVPFDLIISEEKLKKVALMIDNYIFPTDTKALKTLNVLLELEVDDEILSYEFPAIFRWEEKIDIKPIMKNIFEIITDKNKRVYTPFYFIS